MSSPSMDSGQDGGGSGGGGGMIRSSMRRLRGVSSNRFGSGVRNPSEAKRISFFRSFFNERNDDYRSDAAPVAPVRRTRATQPDFQPRSSLASSSTGPPIPEEEIASSRWQKWNQALHQAFRPSRASLEFMTGLITSRVWQGMLAFFTALLLFGSQLQEILIPREGDIVFDVLYSVAIGVFVVDMGVRSFAEPQYFQFGGKPGTPVSWGSCRLGSFLFWCDLVSSLTLLYDISFINRPFYDQENIEVDVDAAGSPTDGLGGVGNVLPIELQVELLVTIGRTLRMARFIRSSTVVKNSSKLNWYWLFQRMNPVWYWQNYRLKSSRQLSTNSLDPDNAADDPFKASSSRRVGSRGLVRHASWGGVQLGVLAAVKKAQLEEERRSIQQEQGIRGLGRRILRAVGIMRNDDEEIRRQIAATKIQRLWRATVNQHGKSDNQSDAQEDEAWAPNRNLGTNPVDKVMHKRSILRQYNTVNIKTMPAAKTKPTNRRSMLGLSVKPHMHVRSIVGRRRPESQVGSAMRELTGQRVAIGIIIALVLTVIFTYSETDVTRSSTMVVLHSQTSNPVFGATALDAARNTSIPGLYEYCFINGTKKTYADIEWNRLREREKLRITISSEDGGTTVGWFTYEQERQQQAYVELASTIFILLVWYFGVTAFAGPVMTLVVVPIERMVKLLKMLMLDPLGYQSTPRYKKFVAEEDELTKNTRWTKEVLKGMETSFLMSTILRIGSLMKVGFGSAGVEIIRNNLERGQSKNMLLLNNQGSTVSCIFLFCDIRQFTDATECLQEEVFVFTNRIAAVVHSICHAYGGSANKNVGDAFLLSWLLEDDTAKPDSRNTRSRAMSGTTMKGTGSNRTDTFQAKTNQADKALLSVVKICMALHHDKFYIETMSNNARNALLAKLEKRKGPVVQMGFGLHAGKAVQGAIGSQRKIDATYVSESVERAEFLESSTKKYGLRMLMSDSFHRLLHQSNRRRCRKIDQIKLQNEDEDEDDAIYEGDVMELFTFDMDIDALWRPINGKKGDENSSDTDSLNDNTGTKGSRREMLEKKTSARHVPGTGLLKGPRRRSMNRLKPTGDNSEELKPSAAADAAAVVAASVASAEFGSDDGNPKQPELTLPTGPTLYNANVWLSDDMRKIRESFHDGLFFQKFNSGLQSYYARDWEHAKQCFHTVLERFEDGPSKYFLKCIEENNGIPPRNFLGYGTA